MSIKAKIVKRKGISGQGLNRMKRYLRNLAFHNVEAGFFEESGVHPSDKNTQNWTYAQLMAFHELSVEHTSKRPVFGEASKIIPKELSIKISPTIVSDLKRAITSGSTSPEKALDCGGKVMLIALDDIFGRTPPLAKNSQNTIDKKGHAYPMIETGALRDALRFKNSKDKKVKQ